MPSQLLRREEEHGLQDSPHSRLGDLLGLLICSVASNAQGVVVRSTH